MSRVVYCCLLAVLLFSYDATGFSGFPGNMPAVPRLLSSSRPSGHISLKAFNGREPRQVPLARAPAPSSYYDFLCAQYDELERQLAASSAALRRRGVSTSLSSAGPGAPGQASGAAASSAARVTLAAGTEDGGGAGVRIQPCSCPGASLTVAELNALRRAPLISGEAVAAAAAAADNWEGSICGECMEPYDFSPLVLHSNSVAGSAVGALLARPRSLLRPLVAVAVLGALKALSALLSASLSSTTLGDTLSAFALLGQDLGQIIMQAGEDPVSLQSAWVALQEGLPVLARTLAVGVSSLQRAAGALLAVMAGLVQDPLPALRAWLSFDLSGSWLLRLLTGRWFWQQYEVWSVAYSLPLVLHVFLLKLLGEAALQRFLRLERGAIMALVDVESDLIEQSITRYLQANTLNLQAQA
jgi:hypothetical protein